MTKDVSGVERRAGPFGQYWEVIDDTTGEVTQTGFTRGVLPSSEHESPGLSRRVTPVYAEAPVSKDTQRLAWLAQGRSVEHDSDACEHWIIAWILSGEPGNRQGVSGRFLARAPSFSECIDKFLAGAIVRLD